MLLNKQPVLCGCPSCDQMTAPNHIESELKAKIEFKGKKISSNTTVMNRVNFVFECPCSASWAYTVDFLPGKMTGEM